MTKPDPFRYFKTSREIIRLAVMLYVRFPLSLRIVEDLLHERGIDVSHEAVRHWWHRFGMVIEFESIDAPRTFYESDAYTEARSVREKISDTGLIRVEGL